MWKKSKRDIAAVIRGRGSRGTFVRGGESIIIRQGSERLSLLNYRYEAFFSRDLDVGWFMYSKLIDWQNALQN